MRLIIEASDFQRLPIDLQNELLRQLAGKGVSEAAKPSSGSRYRWRAPLDLTHDLTIQLMHGLADDHRKRLEIIARNKGRAHMSELLKVTRDTDWHVLSYFQTVITRKLRRILADRERKVYLIGWDYDATVWNEEHSEILDGLYYVSEESTRQLRAYFHL